MSFAEIFIYKRAKQKDLEQEGPLRGRKILLIPNKIPNKREKKGLDLANVLIGQGAQVVVAQDEEKAARVLSEALREEDSSFDLVVSQRVILPLLLSSEGLLGEDDSPSALVCCEPNEAVNQEIRERVGFVLVPPQDFATSDRIMKVVLDILALDTLVSQN